MNSQKNSSQESNATRSDDTSGESIEHKSQLNMNPAAWLEEYGDSLFRYALMQLKDETAAEDALQDTLLSAYRAREQFQGKSSVKTWLMTILRNKVIDIIRKRQRGSLVLMDSIEDDPLVNEHFNSAGIWSRWLNSWGSSPEKLYEQKDFMKQLGNCLESLPENLRQVFILKNVDNLTTEEICSDLSINANNVWVILYRARMRLRNCLDKNWFNRKS
jgi:RNA polymerase sigma-70 factor, ECF subfamily